MITIIKSKITKLREAEKKLRREIAEKTITYIVAAFGLVAGLAWNDAIRSLIEHLFPLQKNSVVVKFIYAILVTTIVVLVTVYLIRLVRKEEKNK